MGEKLGIDLMSFLLLQCLGALVSTRFPVPGCQISSIKYLAKRVILTPGDTFSLQPLPDSERTSSPRKRVSSLILSKLSFPEGMSGLPDRGTVTAPTHLNGTARGHLGHGVNPIATFILKPAAFAFPEAFTGLWDGNTTPAGCGCQEVIPIYCIRKQLPAWCPPCGRLFHKLCTAGFMPWLTDGSRLDAYARARRVAATQARPLPPAPGPLPRKYPRKSRDAG